MPITRAEKALRFTCPACKSKPGQVCTFPLEDSLPLGLDGKLARPHPERMQLAGERPVTVKRLTAALGALLEREHKVGSRLFENTPQAHSGLILWDVVDYTSPNGVEAFIIKIEKV